MEITMTQHNCTTQSDTKEQVVSLKKILEKLFGDEQLERSVHIHYVANLLALQPKIEYLNWINLEALDFDIPTNIILKPSVLIATRKHKISESPITWYVNSIAQLDETESHAINWNILVLRAAIYLIALPDFRPDLFQQNHTEHFNTVKRLFQRFRIANKSLNKDKDYLNSSDYKQFWSQHLHSIPLSLQQFIEYLSNQEGLNDFEQNLLNDIRIPFAYILKNKPKIARLSIETQLEHKYLDEDHLIEESFEMAKGSISKAENIENQLDAQENRQIHVDPTTVTPVAEYSESSQSYVLPLIAKHIQRKEHLLTTSSLFPNTSSTSELLNKLYNNYAKKNEKSKSSLILMLSFITGNKVQEWTNLQSKRIKILNSRQRIIQTNEQFFLRTKFSIFENKGFAFPDSLLNQTIHLDIPIPNQFIDYLREGPTITEKELQKYLKQLRTELCIPKLSLIKISSLLHQTILQRTGNKQLADIITGIDANQSSSISYCHQNIQTLHTHYISILNELCSSFSDEYQHISYNREINFGSRKAPNQRVVKDIFAVLKFNIFSQKQADWISIFNHYNVWMWHLLLLFTGARPVSEFPGFLKSFNLRRQILMISDKEIGGRQGYGRLVPLNNFIAEELQKFVKFLNYIKRQIASTDTDNQQYIQQILESEIPLLNIFNNGKWQTLGPAVVSNFHPELGLEKPNWHRHTARAFLSNKISEAEILALFGHEPMQQEAAHPHSSLSFSQYFKTANILEQMKDHFKISGIELHVLI